MGIYFVITINFNDECRVRQKSFHFISLIKWAKNVIMTMYLGRSFYYGTGFIHATMRESKNT